MTKAQERRANAMHALYALYPSCEMFSRKELAVDIRKLSSLGRTERWTATIEQWACMVEDLESGLNWAYQQGSVYASYAL